MNPDIGAFGLRSSAFAAGCPIPARHSHRMGDMSPPLAWSGIPTGTAELALLVDDPDAPIPGTFVHWVVTGISPDLDHVEEGMTPAGSTVGLNGFGKPGYLGPEPPIGDPPHHYLFRLVALSRALRLATPTLESVLLAAHDVTLATATLTGTYERVETETPD